MASDPRIEDVKNRLAESSAILVAVQADGEIKDAAHESQIADLTVRIDALLVEKATTLTDLIHDRDELRSLNAGIEARIADIELRIAALSGE